MRFHRAALLVLLLLATARAEAAGALVQSRVSAASAATPITLAYTSNNAAGNLLVVVSSTSTTVSGVTDTRSNAWARCGTEATTGSVFGNIWIAHNSIAGANTVSVAFPAGSFGTMAIAEYSGMLTALACDKTISATGFSTSPSSGATAATTQADEVAVCSLAMENTSATSAFGGGFVQQQTISAINGVAFADRILSATGAQTCSATLNPARNWATLVATLKAAAATTGGCQLAVLGVGCH